MNAAEDERLQEGESDYVEKIVQRFKSSSRAKALVQGVQEFKEFKSRYSAGSRGQGVKGFKSRESGGSCAPVGAQANKFGARVFVFVARRAFRRCHSTVSYEHSEFTGCFVLWSPGLHGVCRDARALGHRRLRRRHADWQSRYRAAPGDDRTVRQES